MPSNQNPWDSLKLKPLSPEQKARLLELVSRPIIDPPFHGGLGKLRIGGREYDSWLIQGDEWMKGEE